MKDEHFQKRAFILSSFSRLKIQIAADSYRFADKMIKENWILPEDLDELDRMIRNEFHKFTTYG
jgi:hypothetical protein